MKTKKWIIALFAASLFGYSNADELHHDASVTFYARGSKPTPKIQREISETAEWKNFQMNHGNWWASFNEDNRLPHRAFGRGIRVAGYTPVQRAESFIQNNLEALGMKNVQLGAPKITINQKHDFVDYTQTYQGIEVWNSRLMIQMSRTGEVICFGADVYPQISISTAPQKSNAHLLASAKENVTGKVVEEKMGDMKIIAIPGGTFALVKEITISTEDVFKVPSKWYTLVDAHTGKVWYRQDQISHVTKQLVVMGRVSNNAFVNPLQSKALPNLWIENGSLVNFSDSTGMFNIPNITAPTSSTIRLKGKYASVQIGGTAGRTPAFTHTLQPNSTIDTLFFDGRGTSPDTASMDAVFGYYHVNVVHDYMKGFYPTFTRMDNALPTNIDLTSGTCNAFYNGSSINFYRQGGGCPSFALVADVIYHEYGHGINDKYYQNGGFNFQNGSLGEGYADIWAMGITADAVLGRASSLNQPTSFIRRYDLAPKVYPQDLVGEVHADGEIIAGAWWDVGVYMGNLQQMMRLYAETFDAHPNGPTGNEGEVYTDVLIAALLADDNDNNISNGTPNDASIIRGFARHGLTLLTSVDLIHMSVDQAASAAPINLTATFLYAGNNANFPWRTYLAGAKVIYRVNQQNRWDTTNLTASGTQGVYNGTIPQQSAGTLISYYIAGSDIFGNLSNVQPNGTSNLPYFTLVGFTNKRTEDFDVVQSIGWQEGLPGDNAATGIWEFATPVGSYLTPNDPNSIVQCSQDATSGTGTDCAVTENAPNTTSPAGTADIDAGVTTLKSPAFDLSAYVQPVITYKRWFSNGQGANPGNDPWIVDISNDNQNWVSVERTYSTDRNWRRNAIRVRDYVTPNATVYLRFRASDSTLTGSNNGQSLVEAGVDDVGFYDLNSVGTVQLDGMMGITLFPNPSKDLATLSFETNQSQHAMVKITDAAGRLIEANNLGLLSVGKHNYQLKGDRLPAGVYHVTLESGLGMSKTMSWMITK